jgi:hypothetical protein
MDTPPPPDDENAIERIDSLEERIEQVEKEQRLLSMEERLELLEQDQDAERGDDAPEAEGQKAVRLALASLLNNATVTSALADLSKTLPELKAKQIEAQKEISLRTYYFGLAFSAFVLLFLGALLWYDKLSKELVAGLIGSLIGFWYGRHEKEKS